ncbi:MAG: type IV pilus assembly protein PilM [Actinomycetota bacterium]|nr:type IV pilus assembly protein PilM [Actinomycetota bacterium]
MAVTVGLEIGTTAVRAAALNTAKNPPVLQRFGQVGLPEGAVVGGELMDESVVTNALTKLWKEAKLPRKRVVVGIANQRVIVRRVDVPYMEEDELAEALPFQVQEFIPIPLDEAVMDFVPLEEFATPQGETMLSVLVVAAQGDMVDSVLRVTSGAGLKLIGIDLQAFALVRAVFGEGLGPEEASQAVIDIGGGITQVIIARDGAVRFTRILTLGGQDFTSALVERLGITSDQAELLKRQVGIPNGANGSSTGSAGKATEEEELAQEVLSRQAQSFIDEIRGSVDYYLGQSGEERLGRVMVAGSGARLPNLVNSLGKALGMPVEPARVLEDLAVGRLGLSEVELLQAQPVLPVVVGLALWEARA